MMVTAGQSVLVACSGGPDSLALAAAVAFEAPRAGVVAGAVVVDHGIQPGSDGVAAAAADQCRGLGLAPVEVVKVNIEQGPNLEARAREARYAALEEAALRWGAAVVLLGHTMDDQAETVLLALGRGSGTAAVAGMAPRRVFGEGRAFLRPFLEIRRAQTVAICEAARLRPWSDPSNSPGGPHPSLRADVRHGLMSLLEQALGPGVIPALARTAAAVRADHEALAEWADAALADAALADAALADAITGGLATPAPPTTIIGGHATPAPPTTITRDPADQAPPTTITGDPPTPISALDIPTLAALPSAVRRRVLYRAALAWGADPTAVTSTHIDAVEALIIRWHGQGPAALPGGLSIAREYGRLVPGVPRPGASGTTGGS